MSNGMLRTMLDSRRFLPSFFSAKRSWCCSVRFLSWCCRCCTFHDMPFVYKLPPVNFLCSTYRFPHFCLRLKKILVQIESKFLKVWPHGWVGLMGLVALHCNDPRIPFDFEMMKRGPPSLKNLSRVQLERMVATLIAQSQKILIIHFLWRIWPHNIFFSLDSRRLLDCRRPPSNGAPFDGYISCG